MEGVRDLDVLIRTPDGEPVAGDLTHDAWPVVPPLGPACFAEPGAYVLEVEDDGQGFDDAVVAARRRAGHLGLELLRDLAHDAAANVVITSAPGEGTTVRLELAAHR